jgi:hypothetical protein
MEEKFPLLWPFGGAIHALTNSEVKWLETLIERRCKYDRAKYGRARS